MAFHDAATPEDLPDQGIWYAETDIAEEPDEAGEDDEDKRND